MEFYNRTESCSSIIDIQSSVFHLSRTPQFDLWAPKFWIFRPHGDRRQTALRTGYLGGVVQDAPTQVHVPVVDQHPIREELDQDTLGHARHRRDLQHNEKNGRSLQIEGEVQILVSDWTLMILTKQTTVTNNTNKSKLVSCPFHCSDVTMSPMASQITSPTIVYSTVYSGTDQRKHQSPVSLAFVRGIHRSPVNSPLKGPVTQKMFPFDDVIM